MTVALTLALTAAGCTSSDDSADTTTTSVAAPSSSSSETTSTTATEPDEPTTSETTEVDVEAAVRAAHTFFMVDFFARDEREEGVEPHLELARMILTGPVLARTEESAQARIANGDRLASTGFESNIDVVEVDGDTAKVLDCSRDTGVLYRSDGTPYGPVATDFKFRETWLTLDGDEWLVEEFFIGGDIACDPSAA
ncbi:MAG: hypothetical protein AAGA59_24175 [Actinomycetota bacterium]